MMLKQKSNPWAKLKYLYVLPLTAIAVVAFARPEISYKLEEVSSAKINETAPVKEVVVPKKFKREKPSHLDEPLIIVDGKEVPNGIIANLDPNKIESISVLKDKNAIEKYGEKGKNGVIVIITKDASKKNLKK